MKISRIVSSLTVGGLLCISASATASASSVTAKPSKPTISGITATKSLSGGKVDVTVAFTRATTNAKSPLISTEVKVGNAICRASKSATRCTVKNVAIGKKLVVSARAQNRNGFGARSSSISFIPKAGTKWIRATYEPGTTVPGSVTTTVPGSVTTTVPTSATTTVPTATGLKFNIKNAIGLTLKSTVSSAGVRKSATGSNLQTVDAAGNTSDAVTTGSASINNFLIAPNDKLYVVFNSKTTIGSVSCLLAEVAKSTGDPTCIDSDLSSISWSSTTSYEFDPIQFDESGSIYYVGTDSTGKSVLRRYKDGTATSLVTDNVNFLRFLVLSDGSVIIGGSTVSSSTSWTRIVSASGSLRSLVSGDYPRFLSKFPDGNVYLGYWGQDGLANMGVKRYLTATSLMDTTYWISGNTNGVNRTAFFDVGANYSSPQRIQALEPYYGTYVRSLVATSNNQVYAITGTIPTLVQYFPNVVKTSTAVTNVGVMQRVLTYLILSGTNSDGLNITTLYNTSTDTEQVLIPASTEIEVYHLNYVASTNKIMFDGLRFSDNKYVIGQVDLNTQVVTASQTGSSKLLDFQTFGT